MAGKGQLIAGALQGALGTAPGSRKRAMARDGEMEAASIYEREMMAATGSGALLVQVPVS